MNRSHQLDFFRGLFLILILIDHYLSWDNLVIKFTAEFIGWVSAAEAFVFLSGLTAGLVYTYKYTDKGEAFIKASARKRAWDIYKYHLILILLTMAVLFLHGAMQRFWETAYGDIIHAPLSTAFLASLLLYQPIYLDILPMYAVFLLFVPLVIKAFEHGKQSLVLLVSSVLYLVGTFDLVAPIFSAPHYENINLGFFSLLSWQFLFAVGLFLGYLGYHGKAGKLKQNKPLLYVALGICATLFILKTTDATFTSFDIYYWTDKGHLRPLRVLNFASVLAVVTFLTFRFRSWFQYKPVCYLGRHSLEVFSFHVILVILFKPLGVYLNSFYAIRLSDSTYIYPFSTMLLLFLIPALYIAPVIMKKKNYSFAKLKKMS